MTAYLVLLLASLAGPDAGAGAGGDGVGDGGTAKGDEVVLILDLRPIGISENEALTATRLVAETLAARSQHRVLTIEDVDALVEHQRSLTKLACEADACIAEMAKVANAGLVVTGSVGRIGSEIVVSLTLLDTTENRVQRAASRSVPSLDDIVGVMPDLLAELFGFDTGEDAARVRYALPEGREVSFAVFDLEPQGVSAELAVNLTQVLAGTLKQVDGANVIGRGDVAAMLQLQAEKERMDCADEMGCLAEIGGALGVEKLVVGTVGKLGESYVISLRLIDVGAVRVDNRVNEAMKGLEDQLIAAVRFAGRELLGLAARPDPGTLFLTGSEKEATVYLNDEKVGALPLAPIAALVPGRHSVRISKEGFFDFRTDFYIEPAGVTPLWADLIEEPLAWYERWWLWAIVGVAVAGGVGFGIGMYVDTATSFPLSTAVELK